MPTYSYACKSCDNAFDIQQAFSDDALTVCPKCGGSLRKRYGSVGVVFKGSGFYRTDSRKGAVAAGKASTEAGTSSGSGESGSGGSSSDSASGGSGSGSSGSGASTASTSSGSKSTGSSTSAASA
ncbi:FmdB family zinc ribbon protein [Ornithinimicrobium cryptoxanthini]|uniref:FmdB family zinc ribbon protein n=1 Tax=Ornithinimicrobium cryptoxanthini TaxID=2934161 RepID=UPI00211740BE|nr:FmdB family zinc ribbon protein [Ornithinimicrobium cryptoxanthini]